MSPLCLADLRGAITVLVPCGFAELPKLLHFGDHPLAEMGPPATGLIASELDRTLAGTGTEGNPLREAQAAARQNYCNYGSGTGTCTCQEAQRGGHDLPSLECDLEIHLLGGRLIHTHCGMKTPVGNHAQRLFGQVRTRGGQDL